MLPGCGTERRERKAVSTNKRLIDWSGAEKDRQAPSLSFFSIFVFALYPTWEPCYRLKLGEKGLETERILHRRIKLIGITSIK